MSHDDADLRSLIALAKKAPHGQGPRRDAASFAEFETRLAQRGARGPREAWITPLALLVLIGVGALTVLREPPALSYEISQAQRDGDAGEATAQQLRFSDGSRVALTSGSEARVGLLTNRGARVILQRGQAALAIVPKRDAAWVVQAGPYEVRVTGTAFDVAWHESEARFEIAMRHGSVIVTGPLASGGVGLRAGQRLIGLPREGKLVLDDWRETRPNSAVAAPLSGPATAAEAHAKATGPALPSPPTPELLPRRTGTADRAQSDARGWATHVAHGAFDVVLREAQAAGFARVLRSAALVDLGALADAARYARRDELARRALLALRERFPASEAAQDSAFLLGRLSSGSAALSWYERYLSEQPKGPYVSQALGRSMTLLYQRSDRRRAEDVAATYLARFPDGPYAAAARKITDQARAPGGP